MFAEACVFDFGFGNLFAKTRKYNDCTMHDEGTGTGAYWTGAFFVAGSLAFRPRRNLNYTRTSPTYVQCTDLKCREIRLWSPSIAFDNRGNSRIVRNY